MSTDTDLDLTAARAILETIENTYGRIADDDDRQETIEEIASDMDCDDDCTFDLRWTVGGEYRVMTGSGLETAIDEALDQYLDDCVLADLPESARWYFDRDKWKDDARMDGAGHILGSYDGNELEVHVDDVGWFHIVRVN